MPKLLNYELFAIKKYEDKATFAPNIKRSEEKIDWSKTGEDIFNHIRGLNPWPVAYTLLNESILKIWQAKKLEHNNQTVPGTIIDVRNDGFIVSTGNETAILVTELQPSGKKKMPAKDYLRGAGSFIKAGMKLGEQNEAN